MIFPAWESDVVRFSGRFSLMSMMVAMRNRALLVAVCSCCAIGNAASPRWQATPQLPQVTERVDVPRVVLDVHVLAGNGSAVRGLGPADFRVFVDGRAVDIERAEWVTEAVADRHPPVGAASPAPHAESRDDARFGLPSGRQIVLLIQRDLEPSRFQGLVTMLHRMQGFIDGLTPDDRVAVVSFQSHLDLWCDYTTDRTTLASILDKQLIMASPPAAVPVSSTVSLASYFDRDAGRRAATMEEALVVIGHALDKLPGAKSVVFFGFGLGRWSGGAGGSHLFVADEYADARRLLTRARAAVFSVDITDADEHTLESGLRLVAADTGGFFVRTNDWPGLAMNHIAGSLAGRYEIAFVRPDRPRGEHAVRVELVGQAGTVLVRPSYRD